MDLTPLFKPKTMAVIGVSQTNDRHPSNVIYNKLNLRYPVTVYPVNPKGGFIRREKIYGSIKEIPEIIDHAVIATKAKYVPEILFELIEYKTKSATIISGGFSEVGRDDLQNSIVHIAREAAFPFIGPNCLGIYSPNQFDTFFLPGQRLVRPTKGNVAFISQSGGVLVDQMVKFSGQGIGISVAASIGNKAMIRELDFLEYLIKDPATHVLVFYIEGFGKNEGREFVIAAKKTPKPVIVLKAGKTKQGSAAVSSHTASLAGNYDVFSQVLAQYGVVEAKNEQELISFCEALSCYRQPISGRVGILSVSGGHGVLSVDTCARYGLSVPRFSRDIQERIAENLTDSIRSIASMKNPIDLTGSARDEDFIAAANVLCQSKEIDCVLILLLPYSPGISADLGALLSHISQKYSKPLVAYVPHVEKYRMLIEGFELNHIPVSSSIEGAVLMVDALRRIKPC